MSCLRRESLQTDLLSSYDDDDDDEDDEAKNNSVLDYREPGLTRQILLEKYCFFDFFCLIFEILSKFA